MSVIAYVTIVYGGNYMLFAWWDQNIINVLIRMALQKRYAEAVFWLVLTSAFFSWLGYCWAVKWGEWL